jgi:pimeloyl-ACP methyl ester carboxylesterase
MNTTIKAGTAFKQAGEGPVVVLIHGLGLNMDVWQWQLGALLQHYTVLRYDLLGHGASVKPKGAYTMPQMVDQLHQLLDAQGHQQCVIIGFSLGGLIAKAFTLAHPDRVSALVVMNSAYARTDEQRAGIMLRVEQSRADGPGTTVSDALVRWFSSEFIDNNPETIETVRQWVLANDKQVYPELYLLLANADIGLHEAISTIACPTLILTGEEDYGNSAAMAKKMSEKIPGSKLAVLQGLRHMALVEDPPTVNRILIDFLSAAFEK